MNLTVPFQGRSRTLASTSNSNVTNESSSIGKPLFINKLIHNKNRTNHLTLEEVVDIDRDIEIYNTHQIELLNPKILYKTGNFNFNTQLIRINREEEVFVSSEEINIPLVSKDGTRKIKESGKRLVHLRLIVIGIKGLVRKEIPGKVLITLVDKGWQSDAKNALIAAVEVDMSNNFGLFYCSPDFLVSIRDLDLTEIGIQAKGYDDLVKHSNFLVNIGFIGKLTDNSTTKYKLDIKGIISAISSKGVKMVKPMVSDSSKFNGLEWNLYRNSNKRVTMPESSVIYKNLKK